MPAAILTTIISTYSNLYPGLPSFWYVIVGISTLSVLSSPSPLPMSHNIPTPSHITSLPSKFSWSSFFIHPFLFVHQCTWKLAFASSSISFNIQYTTFTIHGVMHPVLSSLAWPTSLISWLSRTYRTVNNFMPIDLYALQLKTLTWKYCEQIYSINFYIINPTL